MRRAATDKTFREPQLDTDEHPSRDGRVEILTEHSCQGWPEGYLLIGRHGPFTCYEAFMHIVDSMFDHHAKMAIGQPGDYLAQADRLFKLFADVPRLETGS
jgi:phosphoketolase